MEVRRRRHVSYLLLPCRQILGNLTAVITTVTRAFTAEPLHQPDFPQYYPIQTRWQVEKGRPSEGGGIGTTPPPPQPPLKSPS